MYHFANNSNKHTNDALIDKNLAPLYVAVASS